MGVYLGAPLVEDRFEAAERISVGVERIRLRLRKHRGLTIGNEWREQKPEANKRRPRGYMRRHGRRALDPPHLEDIVDHRVIAAIAEAGDGAF